MTTTTGPATTDGVEAAVAYLDIEDAWTAFVTGSQSEASATPSAEDERLEIWFARSELIRRKSILTNSLVAPFTRFAGSQQLDAPIVNTVFSASNVEILICVRDGLNPYDPVNDVVDSAVIRLELRTVAMTFEDDVWKINQVQSTLDSPQCTTQEIDGDIRPVYVG